MISGRLFSLKRIVAYMGALPVVGWPVSAYSQSGSNILINADMAMDSAPLIIGGGALVFGVATVIWLLHAKKTGEATQQDSQARVAQLRADLDGYQAVLACMPEVTIMWQQDGNPQMFGEPEILGGHKMGLRELLNLDSWLSPTGAMKLTTGIKHLHSSGQEFSISMRTRSGQLIRAIGRAAGDATVVRLRSATAPLPQDEILQDPPLEGPQGNAVSLNAAQETLQDASTVLSLLNEPAWVRNANGEITFANDAYLRLCADRNIENLQNPIPEVFSKSQIEQHLSALKNTNGHDCVLNPLPDMPRDMELKVCAFNGGSIHILSSRLQNSTPASEQDSKTSASMFSDINQVMDAMANPIAVFDKDARLAQFNRAYQDLFSFEDGWLTTGLNEREIIDYLRRHDLLPAVSDYRSWRAEHLKSYELKEPRNQTWHLRDGRTLEVVATPDKKTGGVIYTFSDETEQLRLQSANKAMLNVQSESLNALSEGVAVFGTNGRLRLHNPRLSHIWKLPMN